MDDTATPTVDPATLAAAAAAIARERRGPTATPTARDTAYAEAALTATDPGHLARIDRFISESGLTSLTALPNQGARLEVAAHIEVLAALAAAANHLFTETGAINYVDQAFLDKATGAEVARIILVRPGQPSPHDLRLQAEQERDAAYAERDAAIARP